MTETLFSTVFCLAYIVVVRYALDHEVSLASTESLKRPALLAAGAGVAYFVGLVAMPTMILFAMIVAIYTLAQFLYDVYRGRSNDALLVINGVTFAVALVLLLVFGLKNTGIDLSSYSIGHVIAYLGIIAGTAILWGLARYLRGRPWYYFPAALAGVGVVIAMILFVALPDVYNILIGSFGAFFGQYDVTNTVQEARGWSMAAAWSTFQFGLVLMFAGFAVLAYRFWREHRADHLFVFVWSAIILLSTVQHVRYEVLPRGQHRPARRDRRLLRLRARRTRPRGAARPRSQPGETRARARTGTGAQGRQEGEEGGLHEAPGRQAARPRVPPVLQCCRCRRGPRPGADHDPLRLPLDLPGRPRRRRRGRLHDARTRPRASRSTG